MCLFPGREGARSWLAHLGHPQRGLQRSVPYTAPNSADVVINEVVANVDNASARALEATLLDLVALVLLGVAQA
jgi:hypothetical protein